MAGLTIAKTVTRVLQALFAIICLACAAFWADLFKGLLSFGQISFAIFAGASGLLVSVLLGIAPLVKKLAKLAGLPDCIISAVWAVFFLAVGASMASYGTCAAGGGMTGGGSMSRSMALMFGGSLAGSSLTGSTTTTTYGGSTPTSNADIANAQAAVNNMLNQFSQLNNVPMRRLRYTESSTAILGRKGVPAAADASHVMRRQLLGSVTSVMMQPQVLCGTWDAVVACGFINFVMFTATAVIAFMEWKASKKATPATQVQVAKPASAAQAAAAPAQVAA